MEGKNSAGLMSDSDDQEDWSSTNWDEPIEAAENNSNSKLEKTCDNLENDIDDVPQSKLNKMKCEVLQNLNVDKSKDISRMGLNDNKAGMKGLDRSKINQIIYEASKGSKYYENEKRKEEQLKKRIMEQKQKVEMLTEEMLQKGQSEADKLLKELQSDQRFDRYIVHIDLDAFYAAVEMRDDPSLRDKPMAVGGNSMLSTSNYHARRFGVRAAMPGFIGKKLCPELVIVPTNFSKYISVSKEVRETLALYDENFSMMSLDEAYLDFTQHILQRQHSDVASRTYLSRTNGHFDQEHCVCDPNGEIRDWILQHQTCTLHHGMIVDLDTLKDDSSTFSKICDRCQRTRPGFQVEIFGLSIEEAVREMRFRIEQKTRLTASAGIAPNTMIAKVCSDYNKPNGQHQILPTEEAVKEFVDVLPIRKVSGIGNVSEQMLKAVGVELCSDLYHKRALLYHLYSPISFNYFMRVCLGIGSTRIERDGEKKSISTERSFQEINKPADLNRKCEELCNALWEDLQEDQLMGKTVTLKLKSVGFEVKTRAYTLSDYAQSVDSLVSAAQHLLRVEIQAVSPAPLRLRLMGVRMSNLIHITDYGKQQQRTITGMFKQLKSKPATVSTPHSMHHQMEGFWNEVQTTSKSLDVVGMENGEISTKNTADVLVPGNSDSGGDNPSKGDISDLHQNLHVNDVKGQCDAEMKGRKSNTSSPQKSPRKSMRTSPSKTKMKDEKASLVKMFLNKSSANSSLKTDDTRLISPSFLSTCPVCNAKIGCQTLNEMNKHVDECLAKKDTGVLVNCLEQIDGNSEGKEIHRTSDQINDIKVIGSSKGQLDEKVEDLPSYPSFYVSPDLQSQKLNESDRSCHGNFPLPNQNGQKENSATDLHIPSTVLKMEEVEIKSDDHSMSNPTKHYSENDASEILSRNLDSESSLISLDQKETVNVIQEPHSFDQTQQPNVSRLSEFKKSVTDNIKDEKIQPDVDTQTRRNTNNAELTIESQKFTCPICNVVLSVSLGRFNEHVDRCLNQQTISTLIQETNSQVMNSQPHKRSFLESSSQPAPTAKRKKYCPSPKSRSIMSYLKQ